MMVYVGLAEDVSEDMVLLFLVLNLLNRKGVDVVLVCPGSRYCFVEVDLILCLG